MLKEIKLSGNSKFVLFMLFYYYYCNVVKLFFFYFLENGNLKTERFLYKKKGCCYIGFCFVLLVITTEIHKMLKILNKETKIIFLVIKSKFIFFYLRESVTSLNFLKKKNKNKKCYSHHHTNASTTQDTTKNL